jgi:cytochrome c-type biogenesis protein
VHFVALGASFSAGGAFLLHHRDWIQRIGGALIVVVGLYVMGLLRIGVFGRGQQLQLRAKPAGYIGSCLVAITFAIGWTPCVGPILGATLSLAGTAETMQRGVGLLAAYSAGLGVPFLLSAMALGRFLTLFRRHRRDTVRPGRPALRAGLRADDGGVCAPRPAAGHGHRLAGVDDGTAVSSA